MKQAPTKVIALGLSEGHISLIDQARITSSNDKVFKIRLPQRQRVCDIYSFHGKDLSTYPDLPEEAEPTFALKIKERPILYCFSPLGPFGCHTLWQINLNDSTPKWSELASMQERNRLKMSSTVYQEGLVVTGGSAIFNTLNTSEFYHVDLNKWRFVSSMLCERSGLSLVSSDGWLYAIGGSQHDLETSLSSVERIDDLQGNWEMVKPMLTKRSNFAAVACDGVIYAIGGQNSSYEIRLNASPSRQIVDGAEKILRSVERYDPVGNEWSYVNELHQTRCDHSACVWNRKIYVFGGKNYLGETVFEIECYDPATDTWSIVGKIGHEPSCIVIA